MNIFSSILQTAKCKRKLSLLYFLSLLSDVFFCFRSSQANTYIYGCTVTNGLTITCLHVLKHIIFFVYRVLCQCDSSRWAMYYSLPPGNYSRLLCEIAFVRSMGYYLIQIYIPSTLIVVISWVSFWLNRAGAYFKF